MIPGPDATVQNVCAALATHTNEPFAKSFCRNLFLTRYTCGQYFSRIFGTLSVVVRTNANCTAYSPWPAETSFNTDHRWLSNLATVPAEISSAPANDCSGSLPSLLPMLILYQRESPCPQT